MESWRNLKIRHSFILAAALMFCLSLVFIVMAHDAPQMPTLIPSSSAHLICNPDGETSCLKKVATGMMTTEEPLILYMTYTPPYAEIAELLAAFASLGIILSVVKAPRFLKKVVALPMYLKLSIATVVMIGLGVFVYAETLNLLIITTQDPTYVRLSFADPELAFHAFLGLSVASLCFGLLRVGKGFLEGLKSGVMFGTFPLFIVQLCLLHFDPEEMNIHVAMFAKNWSVFGLGLTNWFCLIVAGGLFVLSSASFIAPYFASAPKPGTE